MMFWLILVILAFMLVIPLIYKVTKKIISLGLFIIIIIIVYSIVSGKIL